ILVTRRDPERGPRSEDRRLPGTLALQPVRMVFGERMRALASIRGNAFQARDVDEGAIAGLMGFFGEVVDGRELVPRVEEALVTAGHVVVGFNPEDVTLLRFANDGRSIGGRKRPGGDADVVRPILLGFGGSSRRQRGREQSQRGDCEPSWPRRTPPAVRLPRLRTRIELPTGHGAGCPM